MSLGGVARVRLPGENDDVCQIKLAEGNDDDATLNIEDFNAKNNMTIKLKRDQWAELLVNGIGYHVGYPAVWVAADQPDTTPFALIVVTHSKPTMTATAQSNATESNLLGVPGR